MRVKLQRAVCRDDRAALGLSPPQDRAWEAGSGLSSEAPQWPCTGLVRTPPAHLPAAGAPQGTQSRFLCSWQSSQGLPVGVLLETSPHPPPKPACQRRLLSPRPQLLWVSSGPPAARKGYPLNVGELLMTVRPLLPLWSLVPPES